jgi:hypothetical protein
MKALVLFLSMILITSCDKENTSKAECIIADYNTKITAQQGNTFCFPDGKEMSIIDIQDNRCPCKVICFWEGYINIKSQVTEQNGNKIILNFSTEAINKLPNFKVDSLPNFKPSLVSFNLKDNNCESNPAEDFIIEVSVSK